VELAERIAEAFLAPVGSGLPAEDMHIFERDGWYQVITPSTRSIQGNEVLYSRVAAGDAERIARETIAQYAALGLPFKWNVGALTEPANFGSVLDRLGFESWPMRGMAVDPSRWAYREHPQVVIELVTRDNFDDFYSALVRGWAADGVEGESWRASLHRAFDARTHIFYLARVDGEVAGNAGFIPKQRSVYLVGGNVLEPWRGRGIYRALIDRRMRDIAAMGFTLATTQAREATSAPILERLGFETLYRGRVYKWQP
jgi:GNAT superfamily N-acetyltransferase